MIYHYNYRITNIKINKHYYGIRSSDLTPEEDMGIRYFSSSSDKDFIEDQKNNPKNYKYKIIKINNTREECITFEIKLHNKFDVGVNELFYNKAKQTSTGFDTQGISFKHKESTKLKIKEANLGLIKSKEARLKMSIAAKSRVYKKINGFFVNDILIFSLNTTDTKKWCKKNGISYQAALRSIKNKTNIYKSSNGIPLEKFNLVNNISVRKIDNV